MVLSASAYGIVPIFARFAYEAGATPFTLLAFRYVAASLVLAAALRLRGRSLLLPADRRFAGIATGLFFVMTSYGYLSAVRLIPVSLAVLLTYIYPLLVALIGRLRGERLGLRRSLAVIAAFLGLVLALSVEFETLDPLGVGLALLSAFAYAIAIFYLGRVTHGADPVVVNLHAMATCAVIFVPFAVGTGALALPVEPLGLAGVIGVAVSYFTGVVAFFAALPRIGPLRTALLSQFEPIVTILAAVLILKEQLTPLQDLGIAVLLGALLALVR